MREIKKVLHEIKSLQDLRGDIPTFAYLGEIAGINIVRVRKSLQAIPHGKEVDIVLQSGGGQASDAYRIIRTFREKYEIVNIIVPFWAKSAATILALGGNRLVMSEFGELGPIDVQVRKDDETDPEGQWSSALNVQSSLLQIEARSRQGMLEMFNQMRSKRKGTEEILKIGRKPLAEMLLDYSAKFYQPLLQKMETIELGTMTRSLDVGRMYAKRILKQYSEMDAVKIDDFIDFLAYDCPDHGYVVDYGLLKAYLPSAIRADEQPFGEAYAKKLENLSIQLMTADDGRDEIVGFIDTLLKNNDGESRIIAKDKHENTKKEHQTDDNRGPNNLPRQDSSKGGTPEPDEPTKDR